MPRTSLAKLLLVLAGLLALAESRRGTEQGQQLLRERLGGQTGTEAGRLAY
jgi:hypothetical protein